MPYVIDLTKLSVSAYQALLKQQNLLPSRRGLLDDLDARFTSFAAQGIDTVAALRRVLATPAKIAVFAEQSGIPADYLTLLKRETGTLLTKNIPLAAFPAMDQAQIDRLYTQGIKTTKDYFEHGKDQDCELYALCSLVRINGIGAGAAKMLYAAGYRCPAEVAASDAETMLSRIAADNTSHQYYQGTLGVKDMQYCITMAGLLEALTDAAG